MKYLYTLSLFLLALLAKSLSVTAQGLKVDNAAPIKNLKIISEENDGKGHLIRVVQYCKGNIKVTETITITQQLPINLKAPISFDTLEKNHIEIVVSKSKYHVAVYYRRKLIRTYKAVFGPNPSFNKLMEGDRNTPEGRFTITHKNPASKYNKFMLLSYPNDSALLRFNSLKAAGKIPATARIGGDIGIHGIWKGGDDMIEMGVGWTDGCVALKNKDIEELFALVGVGTQVTIKK
jgi:murein L,D-transpeptidase YafK